MYCSDILVFRQFFRNLSDTVFCRVQNDNRKISLARRSFEICKQLLVVWYTAVDEHEFCWRARDLLNLRIVASGRLLFHHLLNDLLVGDEHSIPVRRKKQARLDLLENRLGMTVRTIWHVLPLR